MHAALTCAGRAGLLRRLCIMSAVINEVTSARLSRRLMRRLSGCFPDLLWFVAVCACLSVRTNQSVTVCRKTNVLCFKRTLPPHPPQKIIL